ncbi:hypothetical protein BC962_3267 [Gillisia mitskevichiae]|uniref:Uncharacterized protein n=1 Tax=Gillisia mitskevichiae TaxID=270921 RepID=A0A495P1H9_9FLAO|nr:hypothetical protein [Gillisia mitskevichiae]RKS42509.1 hypothetical protein BC962_3267 [Gillisia mitskevichiae]
MKFIKDDRLYILKEKIRTHNKLSSELKDLELRRTRKEQSQIESKEILDKEKKEFNNINELSINSIFYSLIGKKEEKLEKERQEFLLAKLNFDTLKEEIDLIVQRKKEILKDIFNIEDINKEYNELLADKEKFLISLNNSRSNEIQVVKDKISNVEFQKKEIDQAILATIPVLEKLEQIYSKLNSAENWGVFDLLGSGLLATAIKHSKIDDAKSLISKTQFDIDNLINELNDVDIKYNIRNTINIDGFYTFSDFFFDGLIFDFIVQEKISKSKNHIKFIKTNVSRLKSQLLMTLKKLDSDRMDLIKRNEELISS